MTVVVDSVDKVWDSDRVLVYDAYLQDTLLPRVSFDDAERVSVEDFESWWEKQEPVIRRELASLFAAPDTLPSTTEVKSGLVVMVPVSRKLLMASDFDAVEELLPNIKEAALMNIRAHREALHVS